MTALERMNTYLARLELRFRLLLASRGAALTAGCALILTLLLVWVGNRFEFARIRGVWILIRHLARLTPRSCAFSIGS